MAKKNRSKQMPSATIPRMRGQGDYYVDNILPTLKKIFPPGTFAKAGGAAGSMIAGATVPIPGSGNVGKYLGSSLGSKISKIVGFGDYTVLNNNLSQVGKAIQPGEPIPEFGVKGNETRVRHREYIGDIFVPANPAAFTNTAYVINPGNTKTFPWLAAVAGQYQQYKFNGLIFEFKTLSSDITAGGALGAVVLATNYDVLEPKFTNKVQMENSQYAVSAKPSCSQIHTVECAPAQTASKLLYVRDNTSSTTASQDARWADLGTFQLATMGLPGSTNQVLGELWASYDVSLYKPEVAFGPGITPVSGRVTVGGGSVSDLDIFGLAPTIRGDVVSVTGSTITFNYSGEFLAVFRTQGTGAAIPGNTGTTVAFVVDTLLATDNCVQQYIVTVAVPGQQLVIDCTAWLTITNSTLRVAPYRASYA